MSGSARLLYVHADEDQQLLLQLERHLKKLRDEGSIKSWHAGQIPPGGDISTSLASEVASAQIVLLLQSADAADSERCQKLLELVDAQQKRRQVTTVQVLVRPVDWQKMDGWSVLPPNEQPVTTWNNRDAAWVAVAKGLRQLLTGAEVPSTPQATVAPSKGAASKPRPRVRREATESTVLFSWLHLSDLHFGSPRPGHGSDRSWVLERLRKDLEHLRADDSGVPIPDALFVTGDIAFSGSPEQYAQAAVYLRSFNIPDNRIFLVPGNHDLVRSADRNTGRLLRELRSGDPSVDDALAHPDDLELLRKRFSPYLSFAAGFGPEGADLLSWSRSLNGRDGLVLRVVGINTALLAADDKDKGNLRIGNGLLQRALLTKSPGELTVVLSHHPFRHDWLADQREADNRVRNHAHVHLSGHVHEADSEMVSSGSGSSLIRISAGAAHGDPGTTSHGYSVAALVRTSDGALGLRLWLRRWYGKKDDFERDIENLPRGKDYAELKLPTPTPAKTSSSKGVRPPKAAEASQDFGRTTAASRRPPDARPSPSAVSDRTDEPELDLKDLEAEIAKQLHKAPSLLQRLADQLAKKPNVQPEVMGVPATMAHALLHEIAGADVVRAFRELNRTLEAQERPTVWDLLCRILPYTVDRHALVLQIRAGLNKNVKEVVLPHRHSFSAEMAMAGAEGRPCRFGSDGIPEGEAQIRLPATVFAPHFDLHGRDLVMDVVKVWAAGDAKYALWRKTAADDDELKATFERMLDHEAEKGLPHFVLMIDQEHKKMDPDCLWQVLANALSEKFPILRMVRLKGGAEQFGPEMTLAEYIREIRDHGKQ